MGLPPQTPRYKAVKGKKSQLVINCAAGVLIRLDAFLAGLWSACGLVWARGGKHDFRFPCLVHTSRRESTCCP